MILVDEYLIEQLIQMGNRAADRLREVGDRELSGHLHETIGRIAQIYQGQTLDPRSFEIAQVPAGSESAVSLKLIVRASSKLQVVARFFSRGGKTEESDVEVVDLATHKAASFASPQVESEILKLQRTVVDLIAQLENSEPTERNTTH